MLRMNAIPRRGHGFALAFLPGALSQGAAARDVNPCDMLRAARQAVTLPGEGRGAQLRGGGADASRRELAGFHHDRDGAWRSSGHVLR